MLFRKRLGDEKKNNSSNSVVVFFGIPFFMSLIYKVYYNYRTQFLLKISNIEVWQ